MMSVPTEGKGAGDFRNGEGEERALPLEQMMRSGTWRPGSPTVSLASCSTHLAAAVSYFQHGCLSTPMLKGTLARSQAASGE